jgi:CMP-N,N'-diacetyllegionaminic acid synthase
MRVLGVIPARGGSKRVPRKNIKLLGGRPLIAWTIEAAKKASRLTTWVVSTDDEAIRDVALSYGAYVIRRPPELAADDSTTGDVLVHSVRWMEPDPFDIVVCLHPTSPIRDPHHIDQAVDTLANSKLDVLASMCKLPNKRHPNIGTIIDGTWHGSSLPHYILNASIYAVKRDWLMKAGVHVANPVIPFFMDRFHSLDIDEQIDFTLGEAFLNVLTDRL